MRSRNSNPNKYPIPESMRVHAFTEIHFRISIPGTPNCPSTRSSPISPDEGLSNPKRDRKNDKLQEEKVCQAAPAILRFAPVTTSKQMIQPGDMQRFIDALARELVLQIRIDIHRSSLSTHPYPIVRNVHLHHPFPNQPSQPSHSWFTHKPDLLRCMFEISLSLFMEKVSSVIHRCPYGFH
jgi:hypothetical protein